MRPERQPLKKRPENKRHYVKPGYELSHIPFFLFISYFIKIII